MRTLICLCLLLPLLTFCTSKNNPSITVIQGRVISGEFKIIEITHVVDNILTEMPKSYSIKVNDDGSFHQEIPIQANANSAINIHKKYYSLSLVPGETLNIDVFQDSISFMGKGAGRNNMLKALEDNNLSANSFYQMIYKELNEPVATTEALQNKYQEVVLFIKEYADNNRVEEWFVKDLELSARVLYENIVVTYPFDYKRLKNVDIDTIEMHTEYNRLLLVKNYVDEIKLNDFNFKYLLDQYVRAKVSLLYYEDRTTSYLQHQHAFLKDSLQGKVQEIAVANAILSSLRYSSLDSVLYNYFEDMKPSLSSKEIVDSALDKHNLKRSLIGESLHPEFANTVVADTAEVITSFEEIMNKYKGKVVYLDIWSLGCGPCIRGKPFTRKLKENLGDLPVEIVYMTINANEGDMWQKAFEISQTKHNHYRIVDGYRSNMHQFMEINWVPCFMIFDKEGKLVDYNADRATPNVHTQEIALEKQLKELALL